jgi:Leucine-rich repeat (LRR) protein
VFRWHEGALDSETDTTIRASLEAARDELPIKLVDSVNHRVRDLCGTPLLCSMVCALHWREEGYLPGHRIELYERCVEMLIEERDRKRGILGPDGALRWIKKADKEMLLQRLAYQMMKNVLAGEESEARIEISKEQAERWIAGWRPNFEDDQARNSDPAEVLDHLIERTGLLREPVSGMLEYTHRSFQEYLAACAAGAAEEAVDLANRAADDQWHEIIILASGTKAGGIPFGKRLILALLKGGGRKRLPWWGNDLRRTYLALAVACLETAKQPEPEISARVLGHLKDIVPPRNAAAAKHLSAAGEAALPYLVYDKWKSESEDTVVACARAVRLIGGERATKILVEGYGSDEREAVLVEVARSNNISVFDVPKVRRDVSNGKKIPMELREFVKELRALTNWYSETPTSTNSGTSFTNLDLSYCRQIGDFAPLATLSSLTELNLSASHVADLAPLTSLTKLRKLWLRGCDRIANLKPISTLSNLESLSLDYCQAISDITPLESLTNLQSLELGRCWHIDDLTALTELPNLALLDISGCLKVRDLRTLRLCQALRTLRFCHPSIWFSPRHLGKAGSRKAMDEMPVLISALMLGVLAGAGFVRRTGPGFAQGTINVDLMPLPLEQSEQITMIGGIELLDISGWYRAENLPLLDRLERLQVLDLSGWASVSDVTALKNLINLRSLNLSGCRKISDLSPLKHLVNLRVLSLVGVDNNIDISPLAGLELNEIIVHRGLKERLPYDLQQKANEIAPLT